MSDDGPISHPDVTGAIVVGDDGSEHSSDAVRWAARDAALRGKPLYVLRGWSMLTAPEPTTTAPGFVPPLADFEATVREDMERAWGGLAAESPAVEVHLQPVHGPAAQVLLEASGQAELVVVGSRGRGGFAELVLGSTADQVVRYSHCPVTVVRSRS